MPRYSLVDRSRLTRPEALHRSAAEIELGGVQVMRFAAQGEVVGRVWAAARKWLHVMHLQSAALATAQAIRAGKGALTAVAPVDRSAHRARNAPGALAAWR